MSESVDLVAFVSLLVGMKLACVGIDGLKTMMNTGIGFVAVVAFDELSIELFLVDRHSNC